MKIAIQAGMKEIELALKEKGYQVIPYGESSDDIKMTIINDVVSEYEEIDPVTFYGPKNAEMILLDGGKLKWEEILYYVEKYIDSPLSDAPCIAIQAGMEGLKNKLLQEGYHVIPYGIVSKQIKITIINDVVAEYEEIDPVTFYGPPNAEMVLLDAGRLSEEEILKYVQKYIS